MEKSDHDLLLELASNNPDLRRLYDRHRKLEKEVEKFGRYAGYSSSAALRQRELKKEKLRGMESMMAILNQHRGGLDSFQ